MIGILLLIVGLTFVNGFFAASEMALVSISPSQLHKLKRQQVPHADTLEKVTKDSTRYLSTIQVAITVAGFLSSAFAGSTLSGRFVTWFGEAGIHVSTELMVVVITLLLSYLTLVFGELVPKRIALAKSTSFALFSAPIVNVVMQLFRPFVWLLSISTDVVMTLLRLSPKRTANAITEGDVKEMIVYGHIKGLYPSEETRMLERIFQLDDLTVGMIMTPLQDIISLHLDNLSDQAVNQVLFSRFSRIPVFEDTDSSIVGFLLVKDILLELEDGTLADVELRPHIRSPLIVDSAVTINVLLSQMRDLSIHLAFVVNNDGQTLGIVTLEDIMEEIVGNIYDEHDDEVLKQTYLEQFTYILDGSMTLHDVERRIGRTLVVGDRNKQTIHHYITTQLGYLPEPGETARIDLTQGWIDVLRVTDKGIKQVRLVIQPKKAPSK